MEEVPELFIELFIDFLLILSGGFVAGVICKQRGVSLLVGYLIVGAILGPGVLNWVSQQNHELEYLARGGALLLLFSIGIEFSVEELVRLRRFVVVGGATQMLLVAIPLTLACMAFGFAWQPAILSGFAGALSSTVLVFKSLQEYGQAAEPHGRRAIGILLFQDIALVPLMLLVPMLTGEGAAPTLSAYALLGLTSLFFVLAVLLGRWIWAVSFVPLLARLRSVELIVLAALCVLGGVCLIASWLQLPPAVGALAAGVMLSGNRLSHQVDTIVLPFRETFAAVFFVTLGTLLQPGEILTEPLLLTAGVIGMLALKASAAALALRLVGLQWRPALGMGLGLAQLGEFSFLIVATAAERGVIGRSDYDRMLFIGLGTLILTPLLLKLGLRWARHSEEKHVDRPSGPHHPVQHAVVIGIGPIGRQVASRLELMGVNTCLVDLSPINLQSFAQHGFHTISGDARDPDVLRRAGAVSSRLIIVSVPNDDIAMKIVPTIRELNSTATVLVRCRFQANVPILKSAGANTVISEESEAAGALIRWCEQSVAAASTD